MKKTKKLLSVICLILASCLIFSGCASVNYLVLVNSDGTIEQAFQTVLEKDKITSAGYDYTEVVSRVNSVYEQIIDNQIINILNYCNHFSYNYSNCGIEAGYKVSEDKQIFYGYMIFSNINVYRAFNQYLSGSETTDEDNTIVQENLFFIKNVNKADTIFTGIDSKTEDGEYENSVVKYFTDFFNGEAENTTQLTLSDVEYNFYYGLPTNKLHSDSDYVYSQSGIKIHQWIFSSDQLNNQISTWTFQIKPVAWYVLALVLSLVVIVVLSLIVIIRKKIKKSKRIENTIAQDIN